MATIRYSDVQKDLMENLYLQGADRAFITLIDNSKLYINKVNTLVQKGVLEVNIGDDAMVRYKFTKQGMEEAHKAFNISRSQ